MLGQMYMSMKQLALAGLRERYPDDSAAMLRRRLADVLLGVETAARVFGPMLEPDR
jgi:hypothetical protein